MNDNGVDYDRQLVDSESISKDTSVDGVLKLNVTRVRPDVIPGLQPVSLSGSVFDLVGLSVGDMLVGGPDGQVELVRAGEVGYILTVGTDRIPYWAPPTGLPPSGSSQLLMDDGSEIVADDGSLILLSS